MSSLAHSISSLSAHDGLMASVAGGLAPDFVVVSSLVQSGGKSAIETIVVVLKDCPHPVLFVPPTDQTVERS